MAIKIQVVPLTSGPAFAVRIQLFQESLEQTSFTLGARKAGAPRL